MSDEELERRFAACRESDGTQLDLGYLRQYPQSYQWGGLINRIIYTFSQLQVLRLSGVGIDVAGLKALAEAVVSGHLRNLQVLNLSNNGIGDAGLKALAEAVASGHLWNLKTLDLSSNWIEDDGLKALAEAVASSRLWNLKNLDLSNNEIKDDGLRALADAATTGHLQNLQTLNLSDTKINNTGLMALADAATTGHLKSLYTLYLTGKTLSIDESVLLSGNASQIFEWVRRRSGITRNLPLHEANQDDVIALSTPTNVIGRSVLLTASDEQISEWFASLPVGAWVKDFQVFWYVGRLDHDALMQPGHAMGFKNLGKSLDEMRTQHQIDYVPTAQNSIKEILKRLQKAIAKTIPPEAWTEDEQIQDFRIDYFIGLKKEHQWTPRARKAWLYVDRLLQRTHTPPKWKPENDVVS